MISLTTNEEMKMKTYEEQNYKHSQLVRVIFEDGSEMEDEIKGLNKGHALYLARKNWEGAKIFAVKYV